MIDTHVNLHHELYKDDLVNVIENAKNANIHGMLSICDRIENIDKIIAIVEKYENFWASVGAHPHEAKDHLDLTAQKLAELSKHPKIIGIGETGLDFHYNLSPHNEQIKVFEEHIKASQITGLPLIVHTREADQLMGDILEKRMKEKEFPLLLHCYTSGVELLKRGLNLGAYVSISGIATFRNATDVRENINYIPKDKLLIETDCPYLSPIPMRGKRNEPAFIIYLLEYLANYLSRDKNELANELDANFYSIFKKAKV